MIKISIEIFIFVQVTYIYVKDNYLKSDYWYFKFLNVANGHIFKILRFLFNLIEYYRIQLYSCNNPNFCSSNNKLLFSTLNCFFYKMLTYQSSNLKELFLSYLLNY